MNLFRNHAIVALLFLKHTYVYIWLHLKRSIDSNSISNPCMDSLLWWALCNVDGSFRVLEYVDPLDRVKITILERWIWQFQQWLFKITLAKLLTSKLDVLVHVMVVKCFQDQKYGHNLDITLKVMNIFLLIQYTHCFLYQYLFIDNQENHYQITCYFMFTLVPSKLRLNIALDYWRECLKNFRGFHTNYDKRTPCKIMLLDLCMCNIA